MLNLLYYEHWTKKQKYFYVYIFQIFFLLVKSPILQITAIQEIIVLSEAWFATSKAELDI